VSDTSKPPTYEYAISLTSQFYFCGIPFRLDVAPQCAFACSYCYASVRGGHRASARSEADPALLAAKLHALFDLRRRRTDVHGRMLLQRVPIHMGGVSDPFQTNHHSDLSIRLLRILCDYDYPVVISTKNPTPLLRSPLLAALGPTSPVVVQVSLTTTRPDLAAALEPGAPRPPERIAAIRELTARGIPVAIRLQPLLPQLAAHAADDLIPAVADAGCFHVIVECLKIPVEAPSSAFRRLSTELHWDPYGYYRSRGARRVGREFLLPALFKWELIQPVVRAIRGLGMTYGSGDYGLNHLGDTECCCGIDRFPPFSSWFKANFASVVRSNKDQLVHFTHVAKHDIPEGSVSRIMNSHSRLTTPAGILAYLHAKWNSPGTANAPDSLLGVSWDGAFDDAGDCIYHVHLTA